jgi:lipopolysaccharide biosynthesis regulator YciM
LALRYLLDIYQQQKRWEAAIAVAEKLLTHGDAVVSRIAHYYCELADIAYKQGQIEQAQIYTQQALKADAQCARASLLTGDMAMRTNQFAAAVAAYRKVKEQDADYLTEIIQPLIVCYRRLDDDAELENFLQISLKQYPRVSLILAQADLIQRHQGEEEAAEYITRQLQQRPSLRGLQRLIALHLHKAEGAAQENLLILQNLVNNLLRNKPVYRCVRCGFGSKVLHWFCPSCKNWNTIKPIQGLEGE